MERDCGRERKEEDKKRERDRDRETGRDRDRQRQIFKVCQIEYITCNPCITFTLSVVVPQPKLHVPTVANRHYARPHHDSVDLNFAAKTKH